MAEIVVEAGSRSVQIALPTPIGDRPDEASKLMAAVERDLDLTGYFEIQDPAAFLEPAGTGVMPDDIDFAQWRPIKTVVLAKTAVTEVAGQLQVDVYVYDVGTGGKIVAKRFTGTPEQARYLGHKVADTILFAVTGKNGFFSSRLLAVGERTGNKEIYVMDIDGHGVVPVTRNGSINLSPTWSNDGTKVAWTSFKRGNADVYLKDMGSGATRVVSNSPNTDSGAAFSPDGTKIAVQRGNGGNTNIYVLDARTGAIIKQLTRGGINSAPAFSPDGTRVAYASDRSGGNQVYVHDLNTGEDKRVSFQGSYNVDPCWSPSGDEIAYVGRDKNFDIFVVSADGRNNRRITQDQGNNKDPSFSPDGRYLVFSSTRNGTREIWMADSLEGRHQVKISQSGNWTQPMWSP